MDNHCKIYEFEVNHSFIMAVFEALLYQHWISRKGEEMSCIVFLNFLGEGVNCNFSSQNLGFLNSLIALKVPSKKIQGI